MKITEIWYFVCWAFGFHSLDTLVEESREVVYQKGNETEPVNYLACEKLTELYPDKTEINLKALADDLYRHFNRSFKNYGRGKCRIEFKEWVLNQTKSGGYLILNGRACFNANYREELNDIHRFLSLPLEFFAIQRSTFDFVLMKEPRRHINQLVVLKALFNTNCDERNSRFFCLDRCFKRRARLARYFYRADEIGLIHLNYNERNETIRQNEKICFKECKRENCKMNLLISKIFKSKEPETFEAHPKLNEFDFWLQFIGLVCSFAGLSINEITSIAMEFTLWKVNKRRKKCESLCFT